MTVRATGGVNPLIEEMEGLLNAEQVICRLTDEELLELNEGRLISARLVLGIRRVGSVADLVPEDQGIPGLTLRIDVGYEHVPGAGDGRRAYDYSVDLWYNHDGVTAFDPSVSPIKRILATSYSDATLRIIKEETLLPAIHQIAQLTLEALF